MFLCIAPYYSFTEVLTRRLVRTTNENLAQRVEYHERSSKLLDNPAVVSKLAEMIFYDRYSSFTLLLLNTNPNV